jgi:hypothetical protein
MATEIQMERKRKKVELALGLARGTTGEPVITNNDNYRVQLMLALNWYNANTENKDIKKYAVAYANFVKNKDYLYSFGEASDHELRQIGFLGRLIMRDQYVSDTDKSTLQVKINNLLDKYKKENKPKETIDISTGNVVSVQDRIQEAALKITGEIDEHIDEFIKNKSSTFSAKGYLLSNQISGAVAKRVGEYFNGLEQELADAITGSDEQLVEGYSYFSKAQLKKFYDFVKSIIDDCNQQVVSVKSARSPRMRKPVPPMKLVAKLKYMKEFAELNLKSVNPMDIIGSSELWVYNTKYRKLSVYKGDLTVKGTTIIGYEISGTDSKSLRKPEEFFKTVEIGKRSLGAAFKSLTTKNSTPNGRINDDCVLIGVFK